MYARSYFNEGERPLPPENYNGIAFPGSEMTEENSNDSVQASCEHKNADVGQGGITSILSGIPILSGLFGKNGDSFLKMPTLGSEEILIIAAAAFLLFSKNGDKECAIFLLILLFVN